MGVVLEMVGRVAAECGYSRRHVCDATGISRTTERRRRQRAEAGEKPRRKPGPRKLQVADFEAIRTEARNLDHGPRRSAGGPGLAKKWSESASRREVETMVAEERRAAERERRSGLSELKWLGSMVVWALDETEMVLKGEKVVVLNVRDLGSGYMFEPLVLERHATCEEVAKHVKELFVREGAPLLMKMDGGGNLRGMAVQTLLVEYGVIPLPSPPYTAPYNGAIERAQGLFKVEVDRQLAAIAGPLTSVVGGVQPIVRLAAHALNHIPKRNENGATPCYKLTTLRQKFSMHERKSTLVALRKRQETILETSVEPRSADSAWRGAVSEHLQSTGLLTLAKKNRVNQF